MIILFTALLKKLIIKIATTHSVHAVNAIADRNYRRSDFILHVLKANSAQRAAVKAACLASNSEGQKHLADIITIFEALPAEKKADFMIAFAAASSLTGGATPYVAIQTAYQGGQIPPTFVP